MRLSLDLSNFDSCPAYNEWLDEQHAERHGVLDIFGYQPRPSEILFQLSQDTYQATFDDFRREWEDQLKELVSNKFPTPVAYYFYRFLHGYENELQRLHLLRDSWEALIDVIHSFTVAECRCRNFSFSDPIHYKDLLSDSVAQRLLNIERIFDAAQNAGSSLDMARIVSTSTIVNMRELNQSRNGFSHSAAQSELQARERISGLYEDVIGVLDDLRGLASLKILRHIGQVDAATLRCEFFSGHSFTKTINNFAVQPAQIQASQRFFQTGHVLGVIDETIVGLRPHFHFQEDATGHVTKLAVFRKTHGQEPNRSIEFAILGDSVSHHEPRVTFSAELSELRGLCRLGPE